MRPRKLRWKAGRVLSVALVLLPPTWPLQAQSLRDPTVAPGVGTASPHALVEPPADLEAINVVVRDGKPYLLVDGLLLNEGSRLQGMRIERAILEDAPGRHDVAGGKRSRESLEPRER